jgi:hypothetical protein
MPILAAFALLQACGAPKEPGKAPFTLSTGVVLSAESSCEDKAKTAPLAIEKAGASYVVRVRDVFSCDAETEPPYLTESRDNKATLVLRPKGNSASCECGRSISVEIKDRLESGNILYVLNDYEVLGHVTVP